MIAGTAGKISQTKISQTKISQTEISQTEINSQNELIWLLLGDVADILDEGLDADNISWLTPVLDVLVQTMVRQQSHATRYLDEVLVEFPYWTPQVDELQSERAGLRRSLEDLLARIRWSLPLQMLADRLQIQLRNWLHRMTLHRFRERELIQSAWYYETGAGD